MVMEFLCRIKEEQKVADILRDLLKLGEKEIKALIVRAKKGMIIDHIGLSEMNRKK
jgi:hypothetical protein